MDLRPESLLWDGMLFCVFNYFNFYAREFYHFLACPICDILAEISVYKGTFGGMTFPTMVGFGRWIGEIMETDEQGE